MTESKANLDLVFGQNSVGFTARERANSSGVIFVRSQVQLAPFSEPASGHKLTAKEAMEIYGWEVLKQIAYDGTAYLVRQPNEPAATLRKRRIDLNLKIADVAKHAGVKEVDVECAETPGYSNQIRTLEKIAQTLALDERILGFSPGAGGDDRLGVRLRKFAEAGDVNRFSAGEVLGLSEAAWVITKQTELEHLLGESGPPSSFGFDPSSDYHSPTFKKGAALADRTRHLLNLGDSPIQSLKALVEDHLKIPVIQELLNDRFAGATVANGECRGIVINERGLNKNVWVRRMTLAHELGHLLWDPDDQLDRLMVDQYDELDGDYSKFGQGYVEMRANAFAVYFLVPENRVHALVKEYGGDPMAVVSAVMTNFGVSATAAKKHVQNLTKLNCSHLSPRDLPSVSDDWLSAENLTVDFVKEHSTPISRLGRFAGLVVKAQKQGYISLDTATMYLKCTTAQFNENSEMFLAMSSVSES